MVDLELKNLLPMEQTTFSIGSLVPYGAGFLLICALLSRPAYALTFETSGMKGPRNVLPIVRAKTDGQEHTASLKSMLLGSVRFFQKQISPIDGPRCNFSPTCSQYGYQAVHEQGSALGVVMIADRLMRCSYWTEDGPDYVRLPNGALYDPVANNLMKKP